MTENADITTLLDATAMATHLTRLAAEIIARTPQVEDLVLLGILTRGLPLAERLARLIEEKTGVAPPVGALATTLYRDDMHSGALAAKTRGSTYFEFNIDEKTVLLVDDVLAAGRTIRAALDEVMHYGRPARIQLACLIDRGGRELPIQADFLGVHTEIAQEGWISVRLQEIDGEDIAVLEHRPAATE